MTSVGADRVVELLDELEPDPLHPLHQQLGGTVASIQGYGVRRIEVDQVQLDLAAIPGVDDTRRVDQAHTVSVSQPGPRMNQPDVAIGDRHRDAGAYQRAFTGLEGQVLGHTQIRTRVSGVGVVRHQPARVGQPGRHWNIGHSTEATLDAMPDAPSRALSPSYSERLYVPLGWWVGTLVMVIILVLQVWMYLPVHPMVTFSVPILITVAVLGSASRTKIEVSDGQVRLGKWAFPCSQVASIEELDQRNTRHAAGAGGDPAAFTIIRPWVRTATKIVCLGDQPPYALVSSRHTEKLSAAVIACATAAAE